MVVVSAAVPILRVMGIMPIRLVSFPIVVSGADAVRLSVTIALAFIVVPIFVTAGIAVTLPGSAARPWHAPSLQNRGLSTPKATFATLRAISEGSGRRCAVAQHGVQHGMRSCSL